MRRDGAPTFRAATFLPLRPPLSALHTPQLAIVEKVEHPDYDADSLVHDIALLRLQAAPACIRSIALPTLDDGAHSQGGAPGSGSTAARASPA